MLSFFQLLSFKHIMRQLQSAERHLSNEIIIVSTCEKKGKFSCKA